MLHCTCIRRGCCGIDVCLTKFPRSARLSNDDRGLSGTYQVKSMLAGQRSCQQAQCPQPLHYCCAGCLHAHHRIHQTRGSLNLDTADLWGWGKADSTIQPCSGGASHIAMWGPTPAKQPHVLCTSRHTPLGDLKNMPKHAAVPQPGFPSRLEARWPSSMPCTCTRQP